MLPPITCGFNQLGIKAEAVRSTKIKVCLVDEMVSELANVVLALMLLEFTARQRIIVVKAINHHLATVIFSDAGTPPLAYLTPGSSLG